MRQLLCTLCCLLFVMTFVTNVKADVTIGYCNNEVKSSGLTNSSTKSVISCAICLTPEMQQAYSFCDITYLHIGLQQCDNLTSFSIWIRTTLSDTTTNITSIAVDTAALQNGWNDFVLPVFVPISTDTLYIGYSYKQSAKTIIAGSGTKGTTNSFFVGANNKFKDYSANYLPLCIRAGLKSRLDNACSLIDLSLSPRSHVYGTENDSLTISGSAYNLGFWPLQQFHIFYSDANSDPIELEFSGFNAEFGEVVPFSFRCPIKSTNAGRDIPVAVNICLPNSSVNDYTGADTMDTLYYEVSADCPSGDVNNLIEEFTSEDCGYAPIGQQRLREAIAQTQQEGIHYIVLSHHNGYGPGDAWRVTTNSDYSASLFGEKELTFAPAALCNRIDLPVSSTLPTDSLSQYIAEHNMSNAFSLKADSIAFDADSHELTVTLDVNIWHATACVNPYVVLCVKQDSAASVAQKNYYPETYNGDWQTDVERCYLTSTDGSAKLYFGADMQAVILGQERIGDYLTTLPDGSVGVRKTFHGTLPNDLTSLNGLTLVGYIYDKNYTGQVFGAFEQKMSSN